MNNAQMLRFLYDLSLKDSHNIYSINAIIFDKFQNVVKLYLTNNNIYPANVITKGVVVISTHIL